MQSLKEICEGGFRATLNFRNFKVALNPLSRIFFKFAKSCILLCLLQFDIKKMEVTELILELKALKAKIKGAFSRSYCCYGNLLCHDNNTNVFTSNWAFFFFFDTMFVASTDKKW